MLTFKISGQNSAATLHLWEVKIQCSIAKHVFHRLTEWAMIETKQRHTPPGPHPAGSLQVFAECSTFMGACNVISNTLFYGHSLSDAALEKKKDHRVRTAARRARELRSQLLVPDLPILRELPVRNSFEHIDDRIDKLIDSDPDGPFIWLHTSRHEPSVPLVLKRFNPTNLTLHYLEETFDLRACHGELMIVEELVGAALRRYQSN